MTLRIWGRDQDGKWVAVTTDANGSDDYVRVTNLCQVIKGQPNESPFYAQYGIPAQQSVLQQVFPDYYVALTQSQFSGYFASLIVSKLNAPEPTYAMAVTLHSGVTLALEVYT